MSEWSKRAVPKELVEELERRFNLDALTASIMARRGITSGQDMLYYREDDLRFQNSPFLFKSMEDAVDRILDALEEGERILIFGDRDVDGVSATTVLLECLRSMGGKDSGASVRYRLPGKDDPYGLSMRAVEEFAAEEGSLIITVDCGISNNEEVARAGELGIDVIIVDHHTPPETLPEPAIIIDAKLEDSGYPFKDISGCAAAYKLVSALRFSRTRWYKEDMALLNVRDDGGLMTVDCIKLRNLVPVSTLSRSFESPVSVTETEIPIYLQGQIVLVWNEKEQRAMLRRLFGQGAEFSLLDVQAEAAKLMPRTGPLPLSKLKGLSTLAKYGDHAPTEIGGFYNIFVSYVQAAQRKEFPSMQEDEEKDMQLVALAALADIMPMRNENRLFVKKGLASINAGRTRPGLRELMAELGMLGKRVTSTDLSWVVVSNLNAAGRLGHPEFAAELFLTQDQDTRTAMARKIMELNTERKRLSQEGLSVAGPQASASIQAHGGKLCVIADERISRGVSGIIAGRLVGIYDVPSIVITFVEDNAIGSMRSCRGLDVTRFLDQMDDIFLNHGGHKAAGGFSLKKDRMDELTARLKELSGTIELEPSSAGKYDIDAEIPPSYLTPELLSISDGMEPFGEENPPLLLMTRGIPVLDAMILGKTEQHLKITVGTEKTKWPALFWNEAGRLHRDFETGDKIDILFRLERNVFNGMETPQMIVADLKRSK